MTEPLVGLIVGVSIGVVEGFWTPLAAKQAAWVVSQMVPRLAEELFERIGNMTPSKATLDRLPKALNERWELLSLKPGEGSGWFKRVRAHAWAMVAPLFERQQAFNSALVDHVNRNIATHRATRQSSILGVAGEQWSGPSFSSIPKLKSAD